MIQSYKWRTIRSARVASSDVFVRYLRRKLVGRPVSFLSRQSVWILVCLSRRFQFVMFIILKNGITFKELVDDNSFRNDSRSSCSQSVINEEKTDVRHLIRDLRTAVNGRFINNYATRDENANWFDRQSQSSRKTVKNNRTFAYAS